MRRAVWLSLLLIPACGRSRFTAVDAAIDAAGSLDAPTRDAVSLEDVAADARMVVEPPDADTALDAPLPEDAPLADDAWAPTDAPAPIDATIPVDAPSPDAAIAPDAAGDAPCARVALRPDRDGDGFGDPRQTVLVCPGTPGYVLDATDCDDTSATSHPGGVETCDCHDEDCNGEVDELPSCAATSHVVWARVYGGPSSDGPWMMASDGEQLHLCGQSWGTGLEILPGEPVGGGSLFQAQLDARTGLGVWGRASTTVGVALWGGDLFSLLGSAIQLERSDTTRSAVRWRQGSTGTGFYGGSYDRLALAQGTGTAFILTGFEGTANVGLGPVPSRGGSDVILYAVDASGAPLWQQAFGSTGSDNENGIAVTPDGEQLAIALYAPQPIDMGGGTVPGTDPFVIAQYGPGRSHVHSARIPSPATSLAFAPDGALYVLRGSSMEIREPDGALREMHPLATYASNFAFTPTGDLYVVYSFGTPIVVGGRAYTPTDTSDGLVVLYDASWGVRWAQQLDAAPWELTVGPRGELYAVGGVNVGDVVSECGGIGTVGGGPAGDGDMVLMMLR